MTNATAVSFRTASPADLDAIEGLLASVKLPNAGVAEMMAADPSQFIVATEASQPDAIVAVCGLESCCEFALLRSVAVRGDWQARGLGHELIRRAVSEAEARGVHALYLLTLTAEHYFPRFGFQVVSRESVPAPIAGTLEFREACPASAVVMSRALAAGTSPAAHA